MKKLATKLTPAIKAWIKEEFGSDFYDNDSVKYFFCFPNFTDNNGFKEGYHIDRTKGYEIVSEQEFLAEFGKPIMQVMSMNGEWVDYVGKYRLKPTPDYSTEIEALNKKANENGMKVTINFEKL